MPQKKESPILSRAGVVIPQTTLRSKVINPVTEVPGTCNIFRLMGFTKGHLIRKYITKKKYADKLTITMKNALAGVSTKLCPLILKLICFWVLSPDSQSSYRIYPVLKLS